MTTKDIIAAIGRERLMSMMDVGSKAIDRASSKNKFTASWFDAVCKEMADMGYEEPNRDLFTFKERRGKRPDVKS
jgi:hypothetical protein